MQVLVPASLCIFDRFKIIMGDPNVKSIFVNIFGGIARCDHIATAVVAGVQAVGGNDKIKPLVVRLGLSILLIFGL